MSARTTQHACSTRMPQHRQAGAARTTRHTCNISVGTPLSEGDRGSSGDCDPCVCGAETTVSTRATTYSSCAPSCLCSPCHVLTGEAGALELSAESPLPRCAIAEAGTGSPPSSDPVNVAGVRPHSTAGQREIVHQNRYCEFTVCTHPSIHPGIRTCDARIVARAILCVYVSCVCVQ